MWSSDKVPLIFSVYRAVTAVMTNRSERRHCSIYRSHSTLPPLTFGRYHTPYSMPLQLQDMIITCNADQNVGQLHHGTAKP